MSDNKVDENVMKEVFGQLLPDPILQKLINIKFTYDPKGVIEYLIKVRESQLAGAASLGTKRD